MIIAELIDYMEHYPEEKNNSKINLIAIEEPESFMYPQMQELFFRCWSWFRKNVRFG